MAKLALPSLTESTVEPILQQLSPHPGWSMSPWRRSKPQRIQEMSLSELIATKQHFNKRFPLRWLLPRPRIRPQSILDIYSGALDFQCLLGSCYSLWISGDMIWLQVDKIKAEMWLQENIKGDSHFPPWCAKYLYWTYEGGVWKFF